MGAKKLERSPADHWLDRMIRDGNAVKQQLSIAAITKPKVDTTYQTRVELDVENTKRLSGLIADGFELYPIVVVLNPKTGRFQILNGFHRLQAHIKRGLESIWAWVVEATPEDALTYAAGCNLDVGKAPTLPDRRKACRMLWERAENRNKSVRFVSAACGLGNSTASRIRDEVFRENGVKPADVVEGRNGRVIALKNRDILTPRLESGSRKGGDYVKVIKGTLHHLGTDKTAAEQKLKQIVAEVAPELIAPTPPQLVTRHVCPHCNGTGFLPDAEGEVS